MIEVFCIDHIETSYADGSVCWMLRGGSAGRSYRMGSDTRAMGF